MPRIEYRVVGNEVSPTDLIIAVVIWLENEKNTIVGRIGQNSVGELLKHVKGGCPRLLSNHHRV
jgi:hypothetical protein